MILYLAFRNLFRNTRRTLAVLLTVALGAGALFSFQGFIHGVLTQYKNSTIHAHYGHGQIFTKGYQNTVYQEPHKHWIPNFPQVEKFLESQNEVQHVFPRVSFSGLLTKGTITLSGFGQGIKAEKEKDFFYGLKVQSGQGLSNQPDGIFLGIGLAQALHIQPGDTVSLMIKSVQGKVNQGDFTVCGIFQTGSQDLDGKLFRIQLNEAQKLLGTSNIESISLALFDDSCWKGLAHHLVKRFPELEPVSFDVLDAVYYQHSVNWLNAQFHVVQIIISLIVLLGIFNTISASILERKQEIGNFRANGESVGNILSLIISEGALLGLIGSCLGIILSYLFLTSCLGSGILMPPGPGLTRQFYVTFKFQWQMVIMTLLLSFLSAIIAAFLSGLKAARMPIAKALRAT